MRKWLVCFEFLQENGVIPGSGWADCWSAGEHFTLSELKLIEKQIAEKGNLDENTKVYITNVIELLPEPDEMQRLEEAQ